MGGPAVADLDPFDAPPLALCSFSAASTFSSDSVSRHLPMMLRSLSVPTGRLLRDMSRALFDVLRQGARMKWTVAIVVTCFFAVVIASCATTDPQRGEVAQADVAELFTLLHRQLGGCWAIPVGAKAAATVRFSLNRDGSLAGAPTLGHPSIRELPLIHCLRALTTAVARTQPQPSAGTSEASMVREFEPQRRLIEHTGDQQAEARHHHDAAGQSLDAALL